MFQIWHDKALVTLSFENLALAEGGAVISGTINSSHVLTVNSGVSGYVTLGGTLSGSSIPQGVTVSSQLSGTTGGAGTYQLAGSGIPTISTAEAMFVSQPSWSGYPSGTPSAQQIVYDHLAYVASNNYNLGSSAAMPNLNFEVEGSVGGFSDANAIYDADPSAVITDYLLNSVYGALTGPIATALTIGSSDVPFTGTSNSFQAYALAMGLLTSPYEDTQRTATDFLQELLQIANSDCFLSAGTLKIKPLADQPVSAVVAGTTYSYTPNLTPVYAFGDDDFVTEKNKPPVKGVRSALSSTYNIVSVEYTDRSNYYQTAPAAASITDDIAKYGPRVASTLSWHQITSATVAKLAGQLWLQQQLYERWTYTFKVRSDYSLLEPLDYISITDSASGLVGQVCRITEIEEDARGNLTITAKGVPGVSRSAPQYNWGATQGYAANYAVDPGVVQTPAIFVMPPVPASLSEGITIGIAVTGPSSNAAWLGCDVYLSIDGGTTYGFVGTMPGGCRYGTISANLSAVADPDTTSTLSVALNNVQDQISTAVTQADADSMQTLVLVGTGTGVEVMAFGAAALVSAGNYNLSYLRRGLYGSTDQAHTSGAQFVRLDGDLFQIAMDPGYAGKTVSFKFVSYNTFHWYGNQTLASSTAYSYTLPSALSVSGSPSLIARGTCAYSNGQVYKATSGASAWDSNCFTTIPYSVVAVSAQYSSGSAVSVGLSTTVNASIYPFTAGTYWLNLDGGNWAIYENGSLINASIQAANVRDVLSVTYDGFNLRYLINGIQVRISPLNGASLYAGVGLYNPGAVLTDVQVSTGSSATPSQFGTSGTAVVNNTTMTKQGGSGSNWDSTAYSLNGYQTCHITGKPIFANNHAIIGLATAANVAAAAAISGASGAQNYVNYGFYNGAGNWQIFESGTLVGTYASSAATDVVSITYDGSTVNYLLNGASIHTTSVSSLTLYALLTFLSTDGAGWNSVQFGPSTNLSVIGGAQFGPANLAALTGSEGINNALVSVNANGSLSGAGSGSPSLGSISGQVGTSQIGNAAVGTAQIAPNSTAHITSGSTTTSSGVNSTLATYLSLSVTIQATGDPVSVAYSLTCSSYSGSGGILVFFVYRGSTLIAGGDINSPTNSTVVGSTVPDTPSAGTYTYTIQAQILLSGTATITAASLIVTEQLR